MLHRMSGVHDDGAAEASHDDERPEIDDQVLVSEGRAPLGDQHLVVSRGAHLVDGVADFGRRQELPLLDVDRATGAAGGDQEIGLPAEERRDLQHVQDKGSFIGLGGLVDVREERDAHFRLDRLQDAQALLQTGPTERLDRAPVGLVERGLEDVRDAAVARELREGAGHAQGVLLALDHARAGDERQGRAVADGEIPGDLHPPGPFGAPISAGSAGTACRHR